MLGRFLKLPEGVQALIVAGSLGLAVLAVSLLIRAID